MPYAASLHRWTLSQGWVRAMPGARRSFKVSHMDSEAQALGASSAAFPSR